MGRQEGFSFSGFLTAAVFVMIAAVVVFKLIPPYLEYRAIRQDMKEIVNDPDLAYAAGPEVRNAFARKAEVDDIRSISAEDLEIKRDPFRLHVKYGVKVPLIAGFGVYFDYDIEEVKGAK